MATETAFRCEVKEAQDEHQLTVTTITCHGRMLRDSAARLKQLVQPLIDAGGCHVVIDLSDLQWLDSSGLSILVSLKVSAINRGLCKFELVNLSHRIADLLKLTKLTELFAK